MRKRLQIGSPLYGIVGDPNNVALEVHTNSGTGIRVKTYTINEPEISVMNTSASLGYKGRNTFVVYGDGKMRIRSLNSVEPIISVGQYTSTSSSEVNGVEKFRMYNDGRSEWLASSVSQTVLAVRNASNDAVFRVMGDGKVSIGTVQPQCALDVNPAQNENGLCVKVNHNAPYGYGISFEGANALTQTKAFRAYWNGKERFVVYADGKTIIGDQQVQGTHSDAILQVSGKAAAKSFYVLKPTTWADEVFENKTTPDIKEIENFIKKHKHLPEIPSEKDVTENGYDVHEMNRLLLKKIEELYLIVIEQGKEIEKMKKDVKK